MQKNVIFDLGNVLIHFDFDIFFRALGYKAGERSLEEAEEPILAFESGLMSRADFVQKMEKIYNFSLPMADFEHLWCNVFSPCSQMIELARKISEKVPVYLFSNTDEWHFPFIWQKFPQLHFFQKNLILSYEIQAVKPDKESYDKALALFSLQPSDCFFIDDRPKNIDQAKELGIDGHIHTDFPSTRAWISQKLNLVL